MSLFYAAVKEVIPILFWDFPFVAMSMFSRTHFLQFAA